MFITLVKNSWGLFLITVWLLACNAPLSEEQLLKRAAEVYQEALAVENEVKSMLDELIQRRNSLSVQGRVLTEKEQTFIDEVYALESKYEEWEKNHVAVPGVDKRHHKRHHRKHDHRPETDLSPKEMLSIQKEFRAAILSVRERANKLM